MKKVIAVIFTFYTSGLLYAQDFDLGGKFGVNYGKSIISDIITSGDITEEAIENEAGIGIVFGGFIRATFGKFSVQPEVLFSQDRSYVKLNDISIDDVFEGQVSKVDIPVMVGYHLFKTFRLQAGPVISSIKESETEPLLNTDEITMGYQLGLGFDISRLTFDARYEGSLGTLESYIETESGTIQFDERSSIFQFTIGYKLFD
jgi:hypothetical protein